MTTPDTAALRPFTALIEQLKQRDLALPKPYGLRLKVQDQWVMVADLEVLEEGPYVALCCTDAEPLKRKWHLFHGAHTQLVVDVTWRDSRASDEHRKTMAPPYAGFEDSHESASWPDRPGRY